MEFVAQIVAWSLVALAVGAIARTIVQVHRDLGLLSPIGFSWLACLLLGGLLLVVLFWFFRRRTEGFFRGALRLED